MARIEQDKAGKGSQKWIQLLVNRAPDVLNVQLRSKLGLSGDVTIEWRSPLEDDSFAEYLDGEFLERVEVTLGKRSLESFWPRRGPNWDGLVTTSGGDVILVEAKSHVSEMESSSTAKSPKSKDLIQTSMAEAAEHYGATKAANWDKGYYQYANRLAHLYLLRELNGIEAWLVFLNFVNDTEMKGPKSVAEWEKSIDEVHRHLGVTRPQLGPHVVDLFVDVSELAEREKNWY